MLLQSLIEEDYGYEHNSGIWGRAVKHNSLVVKEDEQFWFWNSMGLRGNVRDYLILVRRLSQKEADDFLKQKRFFSTTKNIAEDGNVLPYEKLVEILWTNGKDNRDYWYRRCLTDYTINKFRLGFYSDWYLIPLYHESKFVNFETRRDLPNKAIGRWYKHTKPVLYNAEILEFVDKIFITEGTTGAILLNQMGFPAVSQMGSNIWQQEWFGHFSNIREIYYVEDNDSAGRIASENISKFLGLNRVKIISFDGQEEKYDAVDFFRDGGSVEDFKELVANSKYLYERQEISDKRGSNNFSTKAFTHISRGQK